MAAITIIIITVDLEHLLVAHGHRERRGTNCLPARRIRAPCVVLYISVHRLHFCTLCIHPVLYFIQL